MAGPAYLLDTGIVLLATRASNASKVIDAQFGLRLTVLSTDKDFKRIVTHGLVQAVVVDPKTGIVLP